MNTKMNTLHILAISFLFSVPYSVTHANTTPCYLKTPFAELDGKFNIEPVYNLMQYLDTILQYDFNQNPNNPCTLHDLAAQEHMTEPAKVERFLQRCIPAFAQALHQGNHIKGLLSIKGVVDKLVDAWGKQRHKEDSIFFSFCKTWKKPGTEAELLNNSIHTIGEYEQFIGDFKEFLIDVLHSFPKSRAALTDTQTRT